MCNARCLLPAPQVLAVDAVKDIRGDMHLGRWAGATGPALVDARGPTRRDSAATLPPHVGPWGRATDTIVGA